MTSSAPRVRREILLLQLGITGNPTPGRTRARSARVPDAVGIDLCSSAVAPMVKLIIVIRSNTTCYQPPPWNRSGMLKGRASLAKACRNVGRVKPT